MNLADIVTFQTAFDLDMQFEQASQSSDHFRCEESNRTPLVTEEFLLLLLEGRRPWHHKRFSV